MPQFTPEAAIAVEAPRAMTFDDHLHHYAEKIRSGDVTAADLSHLSGLAGQIGNYGFDVDHPFFDADGHPLSTPDAELVLAMSNPGAWVVQEEQAEDLYVVHKMFTNGDSGREASIESVLDPRIPLEEVKRVANAQEWLGDTLGIINPYRFTLDELARKIEQRLVLSDDITSGRVNSLYANAMPSSRALTIGSTTLRVAIDAQAGSPPAEARTDVPTLRQEPHIVPTQRSRSRAVDSNEPITPFSGNARSHRKPPERPGRIRRMASVAAVAILGFLVGPSLLPGHGPTSEKVVTAAPSIAPGQAGSDIHNQSPPETPPPASQEPHIMSLGGGYNPEARTGAIWFNVEDYAAQLAHSQLTLLQIHLLTDRSIQYMNTVLPDGMSWDKARYLPPNAQLPYPPSDLMRAWIDDVIARTIQTDVTTL